MTCFLVIVVFAFGAAGTLGFLLDTESPLKGSTQATTAPERCSINAFSSCTDDLLSILNINGTDINIDGDALREFYCGPNVTSAIQCLKDHIDPNCGNDTDAALVNDTLARIPPDYSYDSICKNTEENNELIRCQTLLPSIEGFQDCVTGETLNKTIDPTDTCNFFEATVGCSYKYTEIMCPTAMNAFKQSAGYVSGCTNINYETSEEARSCDEDMHKACDVSYDPPSYENATGLIDFACSGKSQLYLQCLHKVYDICKDKNGFNATTLNGNLDFFEKQTAATCSEENKALAECTAMFPKLGGFQDCVTGVTLNKTVDPTNICEYFQTITGCTSKYTDLMCPGQMDALQKAAQIPPSCSQPLSNISQEVTSCDAHMGEACAMAYKLPLTNAPNVGESYYDFICSGRASGYTACSLKVNSMCYSPGSDVSAVLNSVQTNIISGICSDKTGYITFTDCMMKFSNTNEFANCISNLPPTPHCSAIVANYKCTLSAVMKTCPASEMYYKKYSYESLKACNATSTIDIPVTVASASGSLYLSVSTLVACVSYIIFWHMSA